MELELRRLMGAKDAKGITEALAWDDLTGMKLDGHKLKEARAKDPRLGPEL